MTELRSANLINIFIRKYKWVLCSIYSKEIAVFNKIVIYEI